MADRDWARVLSAHQCQPDLHLSLCLSAQVNRGYSAIPHREGWRRGRIMKSWLEILLPLARCPPYYCVQQLQGMQGRAGQAGNKP